MWVEDIVSSDVNIMAEFSQDDANNFVKLCQMLYSQMSTCNEVKFVSSSTVGPKPPANLNPDTEVISLIETEIAGMSQPSFLESRRRSEVEIISILTKNIKSFDASLDILVFGSSHYGIKGSNTNLNFLINTRMFIG